MRPAGKIDHRRERNNKVGFKPQTAIHGVFSVAVINLLARLIGYGRHVIITAFIGLSVLLDTYYIAATILSLVVLAFGDVFDSLGIPRLVKTLQEEGEEEFRAFAGSILAFASLLSVALVLLLFAIAPWATWIAPGFTPDKKDLVLKNLHFLAPMALLYLPYHALGSILRARRRFKDFYIGDLIIATTALAVLYLGRRYPYIVPLSYSAGYAAVFVYIAAISAREMCLTTDVFDARMVNLFTGLLSLLPLYLTSYLFIVVDRVFASFLPTGGISALSYGLLIAQIPSSILMIENIFITPLSESSKKEKLMNDTFVGVLIITIPVVFFVAAYAGPIIRTMLERGAFTPDSTKMTADALTFISFAIPIFFLWPVLYRLFQILEKLKAIAAISVAALLLNAALNALFLKMDLGVKGLALATSISNYVLAGGAIVLLRRNRILVFDSKVQGVLGISLAISGIALGLAYVLPVSAKSTGGLFLHGVSYVLAVGIMFYAVPNESIRYWRETVLGELNPFAKR
jgi:putative peptidoglycan lipid II flippase